jgi:hypothetical protein
VQRISTRKDQQLSKNMVSDNKPAQRLGIIFGLK